MANIQVLCSQIKERGADWLAEAKIDREELTLIVKPAHLLEACTMLRDGPCFGFDLLVDICGVDYLHYGKTEWQTTSTSMTGFGRGVEEGLKEEAKMAEDMPCRFAVVYHLLSLNHNHRVRLRVPLPTGPQEMIDSVIDIWPAANWYEREVFDLFGVLFKGHPDLRRILTDYGFVGHPFRKDFPLIGKVEVRYDAALQRVIYGPVSIAPRVLGPKVVRQDNRYVVEDEGT